MGWSSLTAVVFDDGARILDYNKCIDARSTCGCIVVVDVGQDMDAMLERRPSGLRLEHTVWLAAFRDEFLNLMPHQWVTEVAVTLLILIDRERLIEILQPTDAATDDYQTTRDRGIRKLPHFPGPQVERETLHFDSPYAKDIGGPAILGPSGSHPWLLKGSEDPWLCVPDFGQVCLFCCCKRRVVSRRQR